MLDIRDRYSRIFSLSNYKEIQSDNLPGGLLTPKSPKRQPAVGRLSPPLSLSRSKLKEEKKTSARQAFPDNFESRWLPQRAMISTWMDRLRLQQSELSLSLPSLLVDILIATGRNASIARSAIIQASLAKGFLPPVVFAPRKVYIRKGR